jgi:hypothetical protein
MPIPESQLQTWSHPAGTTTAKATHESIRVALDQANSPLRGKDYEVYLQGSYKNDTNIRGDSDVDVVVKLNSTFASDLSGLSEDQRRLYREAYPDATYLWQHFRSDVLAALRKYYGGAAVKEGNKSLKLAGGSGRLPADIVVAIEHRKYVYFYGKSSQFYVDGIKFYSLRDNRGIINFPKPHYENGVKKNSANQTDGWYKPTVRMFKNARTYLTGRDTIPRDLAPSYFLECLLYNVPSELFGTNYQATYSGLLRYFSENTIANSVCQNEQQALFGDTPEQWQIKPAIQLISELIGLWNNWRA